MTETDRRETTPGLRGAAIQAVRAGLLAIAVLLTALAAPSVRAHTIGESYLYLQVYEERVTGRFEVALSDFNEALGLVGTPGEIRADRLEQHESFLHQYYRDHVVISHDGSPLTLRFTETELLKAEDGYVLLSFELPELEGVPERLSFDYSVLFDDEPDHRGFLLIEHNWATGTFANENQISLIFSPDSRSQSWDFTTSGRLRGFLAVVGLGIEHIWEGVDHILFLVALLIPAVLRREDGKWRPVERLGPALIQIVKIVTAFTVAHSVTLSLASLGIVDLPGKLVEVVIAASIAIAAADLLFPIFRGRVWLIVAAFGLFHGFGFAGALSEMGVLHEHLGWSLFAFNLGVEIGQIAIVVVLVPILFMLRGLTAYSRILLPVAAVGMILISTAWVIERSFDVDLPIRELVEPILPGGKA